MAGSMMINPFNNTAPAPMPNFGGLAMTSVPSLKRKDSKNY